MTFNLKNVSAAGVLATWYSSGSLQSHQIPSGEEYEFEGDTLSYETSRLITLGIFLMVNGSSPQVYVDTRVGVPVVFRGTYNPTALYKRGQEVMFGGTLYLALFEQSGTSPSEEPSNWLPMVGGIDSGSHTTNYSNPHNTTAAQVGAVATALLGNPDGVATLDGDGLVPASQLPAWPGAHTQNSDTALSQGNGNEVTAAALRAHLDETAGNPHGLTPTMIGAVESSLLGVALGVATLDSTGKLNASQVPVSDGIDVRAVANTTLRDALAPSLGAGAMVAVEATNKVYSWSGSAFSDTTSTHAWVFFVNGLSGTAITLTTDDIDEANGKYYFTDGRLTASAPFQAVDTLKHTRNADTSLDVGGANEISAATLKAHILNTGNPHSVTPSQIGALADVSDDTSPELAADLDATSHKIVNLATPTASGDAVNKAYADTLVTSGVSDGDKGDITATSAGTVWTIDPNVVSYAKMQDITATKRVIGRNTSGAGDPEEVTASQVLDWVGTPAQGDIAYRGAATWALLPAGTAGYVLQTGGAGANPSWLATGAAGLNLLALAAPGTVSFIQLNGDGTVQLWDAEDYRTAIGLGSIAVKSAALIHGYGTTGAKPAAGASNEGHIYYDTDLNTLSRSNGTTYDNYSPPNTDTTVVFTDNTTGDATTSQHGFLPKLGGGTTDFLRADGTWAAPEAGLEDGAYGDIFVSDSGATLTIEDDVVTFLKLQDISTKRVIGRDDAGPGDPQMVEATQILDWLGTPAQGDILYRNATDWVLLAAGASGRVLMTGGAGANPAWATIPESAITFTDITTNDATTSQHGYLPKLGGGTTNFLRADGTWAAPTAAIADGDYGDVTVSSSGTAIAIDPNVVTYAKMQDISVTKRVVGRNTAGSGDPEEVTATQILDWLGSAAQGDILYRNATDWVFLAAGTAGYALVTGGAGANPAWGEVGTKNIPQNSLSAAYTTVLADAGKHLYHPSSDASARVWTIDSNANVPYPIGTVLTFANGNGAGVITIDITSDTMRLAGTGTTGSRTLASNGMATALKVTATEWLINGSGLT